MRALRRVHSIPDLQRAAARRLPRMVREFVDGGADAEVTVRANEADFASLTLRPDHLVDVAERSQSIEVFGVTHPNPVGLAPAGLARLVDIEGETAAARAAAEAGAVFCVSMASSCSIEEIADAAPDGHHWLQLYLWKDRDVVADLVQRAAQAGYEALCLTIDVPIVGNRRRDVRNGMSIPPKIRPAGALDALRRPQWLYGLARGRSVTFRNLLGLADGDDAVALGTYVNTQLINPTATWADVAWLRSLWDGPLVIKGVLSADDGRRAVDHGADGVNVSNHGGRQLDGAPSAISALRTVGDADLGVPLFLDGGVRTGTDVIRAKASGATMVFVGRPWFWGLAAGGAAGVSRMFDIFSTEIDRTQALIGRPVFADIGGDVLDRSSS